MVTWVQDNIAKQLGELKGAELDKFKAQIDDVTLALTAEAGHSTGGIADLDKRVAAGREVIVKELACIECHKFRGDGEIGAAPDLTGYASRDWLTAFLSNPADNRFYGDKNDRMPAFAAHPNDPTANRLSLQELSVLVSWLRGEWYEPASVDRSGANH
jgi:ubiquinol-cytochrome c reductase cytochrome b subunit